MVGVKYYWYSRRYLLLVFSALQNQCEIQFCKILFSYEIQYRFIIFVTRSKLPYPGYQILASRILPTRSWPPDLGYQILATSSWLPDPDYQIWATRSCRPDSGSYILATTSRVPEPGYQALATRSWLRDFGRFWLPAPG